MSEHSKKKIAPIVITTILLVYYVVYFAFLCASLPLYISIFIGIIPLLIGGTTIYVCIQRLKEIDGGEEDDLSKY